MNDRTQKRVLNHSESQEHAFHRADARRVPFDPAIIAAAPIKEETVTRGEGAGRHRDGVGFALQLNRPFFFTECQGPLRADLRSEVHPGMLNHTHRIKSIGKLVLFRESQRDIFAATKFIEAIKEVALAQREGVNNSFCREHRTIERPLISLLQGEIGSHGEALAIARIKLVERKDFILRGRAEAEIIVPGVDLLNLTGIMQAPLQLKTFVLRDVIAGSRRAADDRLRELRDENAAAKIPYDDISLNQGAGGIHHRDTAAKVGAVARDGVLVQLRPCSTRNKNAAAEVDDRIAHGDDAIVIDVVALDQRSGAAEDRDAAAQRAAGRGHHILPHHISSDGWR